MPESKKIAIIGLGLIGSSIARGVQVALPDVQLTGFDSDEEVRERGPDWVLQR
jgi:cyclohexadieny/prephenate dehydrogenase